MNIRDHIEAGHYPKDDKGRALVPVGCNRTATICATDAPGEKPILGFIPGCGDAGMECPWVLWDQHGNNCPSQPRACWVDLLPPPPRKVKVTAWAIKGAGGRILEVRTVKPDNLAVSDRNVVELTGEYEEPWS